LKDGGVTIHGNRRHAFVTKEIALGHVVSCDGPTGKAGISPSVFTSATTASR
jgi:hypothetical protein